MIRNIWEVRMLGGGQSNSKAEGSDSAADVVKGRG